MEFYQEKTILTSWISFYITLLDILASFHTILKLSGYARNPQYLQELPDFWKTYRKTLNFPDNLEISLQARKLLD